MTHTPERCPYCAEDLIVPAARCPHCASRLRLVDPVHWHRRRGEARIAGVAAGVARAISAPLTLIRAGLVILTFFHLLGPIIYVALWLTMPPEPGRRSLVDRHLGPAAAWLPGWERGAEPRQR